MVAPTAALILLPRLETTDPQSILDWSNALVMTLEQQLRLLQAPAGAGKYTFVNSTPLRALTASTATTTQVAEVVCTLIADLQSKTVIG
jgi:hypothetical protein